MMKRLLYLFFLFFIFGIGTLHAQLLEKISLETNLLRFSKEPASRSFYSSPHSWSFVNGLRLNFKASPSFSFNLGVRNVSHRVEFSNLFIYEKFVSKGGELEFGVEKKWPMGKLLTLHLEAGSFYERAIHQGIYQSDVPPTYEINHELYYTGFFSSIKMGIKLRPQIKLLLGSRFRTGYFEFSGLRQTLFQHTLLWNREEWRSVLESLSSFGLRITLS